MLTMHAIELVRKRKNLEQASKLIKYALPCKVTKQARFNRVYKKKLLTHDSVLTSIKLKMSCTVCRNAVDAKLIT